VTHNDLAVGGKVDVEFKRISSGSDSERKRAERVLRRVRAVSAMRDDGASVWIEKKQRGVIGNW
jgi:hypothetical protein